MWAISQTGDDNKSTRSLLHFTEEEKQRLAGRLPEKELTKAATDKVDAEIQQLKNKKAQLEQKISSAQNPDANLQKQLAQIENELRQKDNDTYRKTHAKFSSVDITI